MGSYLQKPVVQKESYEGNGQEYGLQNFSGFMLLKRDYTLKITTTRENHIRDINGDQQQCKDGEQIWKIHIFIRFEDF